MRDDIPAAACRLLATLPVHTHTAPPMESQHWRAQEKRNHNRPIKIAGNVYENMTIAAAALGTHRDAIRKMVSSGAARYLDGKRKSGRGCRTITYKGTQYAGVMDAMRRLGIGKSVLYKLLDSGEAKRD